MCNLLGTQQRAAVIGPVNPRKATEFAGNLAGPLIHSEYANTVLTNATYG